MRVLPFFLVYIIPVLAVYRFHTDWRLLILIPAEVFVLIPVLDLVFGEDRSNPPEERVEAISEKRAYRYVTWALAPIQLGLVIWGAWAVNSYPMDPYKFLLLVVAVGIPSGVIGINVAHELVHKINNRLEPFLGRVMLASVFYSHWATEHVAGHHRWVATRRDPATARFGESFYRFLPRTVFGGFESAMEIEATRLGRMGKPVFSRHNRILVYMAAQILFVLALGFVFGHLAVPFYFLQAAVAVGLLEAVNYLEHYGLERKIGGDGKPERVTPVHSWNSSARITNYYLFNLQRHSDHHANPARRYQVLRHFDESPQLPTGYAALVPLALVPPLWRMVMDKRVLAHRRRLEQGD